MLHEESLVETGESLFGGRRAASELFGEEDDDEEYEEEGGEEEGLDEDDISGPAARGGRFLTPSGHVVEPIATRREQQLSNLDAAVSAAPRGHAHAPNAQILPPTHTPPTQTHTRTAPSVCAP